MNCFYLDLHMSDFILIQSEFNNNNASIFVVDTQADISIFKASSITSSNLYINPSEKINIKGITNNTIRSMGTAYSYLYLKTIDLEWKFHIVSDNFEIPADGILGKDFLKANKCRFGYDKMIISIDNFNQKETIPLIEGPNKNTMALPARSEVIRNFPIYIKEDTVILNQEILPGVYLPRTIVSKESPYLRILNTTSQTVILDKNVKLKTQPLSDFKVYNVENVSRDPNHNKKRTEELLDIISKNVSKPYKQDLLSLCMQFPEIFLLDSDPMTVNNFYKQSLRINDNNPVYIKNY